MEKKMEVSRRTKKRRIIKAVQKSLARIRKSTLQAGTRTPILAISNSDCESSSVDIDNSISLNTVNSYSFQSNQISSSVNFLSELRVWAAQHNLTHSSINDLLNLLRTYKVQNEIPKDARTLLKTPRTVSLVNVDGGEMFHFGIKDQIFKAIDNGLIEFQLPCIENLANLPNLVTITVGIDGLPISKSSKKQFWPILGYIDQAYSKNVFPISLYYGDEVKPQNLAQFLDSFVKEISDLEKGFLYKGKIWNFRVRCIVADAPARSFLKCISAHNGYFGCERCYRKGKHSSGRLLYSYKSNELLHSDFTFKNKEHISHHVNSVISPLENLKLGMISQIPIDYMHLCCLGIMKKILILLKEGPLPHKMRPKLSKKVSKRLEMYRLHVPCEFNRKTRGLNDLRFWKATELRTFMLYVGPCALNDILDKPRFNHFMLFHTAMYILISNAAFNSEWIKCASCLLDKFNQDFSEVYSKDCMIYNVHMLKHLHLDSLIHGPLDRISAFPFENFMQPIKRMLRKQNTYLSQIVKRIKERECLSNGDVLIKKSKSLITLRKPKDNCYLTCESKICMLKEVLGDSCILQEFLVQEEIPYYPINSSKLGIYYVEGDGASWEARISILTKKCVRIPSKNGFVCIPLCSFEM